MTVKIRQKNGSTDARFLNITLNLPINLTKQPAIGTCSKVAVNDDDGNTNNTDDTTPNVLQKTHQHSWEVVWSISTIAPR